MTSEIHFFFCLCYWLIEETNAAEHYERTKFELYKDDNWLVLTLTYVLMDNFLSLFRKKSNNVKPKEAFKGIDPKVWKLCSKNNQG